MLSILVMHLDFYAMGAYQLELRIILAHPYQVPIVQSTVQCSLVSTVYWRAGGVIVLPHRGITGETTYYINNIGFNKIELNFRLVPLTIPQCSKTLFLSIVSRRTVLLPCCFNKTIPSTQFSIMKVLSNKFFQQINYTINKYNK